jgi:predicted transcriptional regulator
MGTVRHILDLDPETDARIKAIAARTGRDAAAEVAYAVELLDSVIDVNEPEIIEEDLRRLEEFDRTGIGVPGDEVIAWIKSWGTPTSFRDRSRAKSDDLHSAATALTSTRNSSRTSRSMISNVFGG